MNLQNNLTLSLLSASLTALCCALSCYPTAASDSIPTGIQSSADAIRALKSPAPFVTPSLTTEDGMDIFGALERMEQDLRSLRSLLEPPSTLKQLGWQGGPFTVHRLNSTAEEIAPLRQYSRESYRTRSRGIFIRGLRCRRSSCR